MTDKAMEAAALAVANARSQRRTPTAQRARNGPAPISLAIAQIDAQAAITAYHANLTDEDIARAAQAVAEQNRCCRPAPCNGPRVCGCDRDARAAIKALAD